jgi:hypothetical protein
VALPARIRNPGVKALVPPWTVESLIMSAVSNIGRSGRWAEGLARRMRFGCHRPGQNSDPGSTGVATRPGRPEGARWRRVHGGMRIRGVPPSRTSRSISCCGRWIAEMERRAWVRVFPIPHAPGTPAMVGDLCVLWTLDSPGVTSHLARSGIWVHTAHTIPHAPRTPRWLGISRRRLRAVFVPTAIPSRHPRRRTK